MYAEKVYICVFSFFELSNDVGNVSFFLFPLWVNKKFGEYERLDKMCSSRKEEVGRRSKRVGGEIKNNGSMDRVRDKGKREGKHEVLDPRERHLDPFSCSLADGHGDLDHRACQVGC